MVKYFENRLDDIMKSNLDIYRISNSYTSLLNITLWFNCMIQCVTYDSIDTLKYCESRIIRNKIAQGHGDKCKVSYDNWFELLHGGYSHANTETYRYCEARLDDEQCSICVMNEKINKD